MALKPSIEQKLNLLSDRFDEIRALLSDPNVINNQHKFKDFSKEYAELTPTVDSFRAYLATKQALNEANAMLADPDPEVSKLAQEEVNALTAQVENQESQLQILLLPVDPQDTANVFLEIRAAAGGDEAAIFAGDLFRMYLRHAQNKHWQVEIVHQSPGEHGGYKIIVARIVGQNVYSHLKFESGAHRVQRVPETEAQGRVHTSTCTVAILPEVEEIENISINPNDLRIDTFRSSGAGGQHVQKTDSAIRITHIPTGLVVECQEERSQHKNKAKAMALLQARLLDQERSKQQQAQAQTRRNLVGTGDRSERIRTYNYPQGRITDHRINLTLYQLPDVMEGDLDQVIEPLRREYQADLLAQV